LVLHGVLDWEPEAVKKWQVPASRPSGFYCTRYTLARSADEAVDRVLADVRSYYEDTTDWFLNNLLTLKLEVDEIRPAPFYKGFLKDNLGATFYP